MRLQIVLKDSSEKGQDIHTQKIEIHGPEASQIFKMQLCARQCAQCQGYSASKTVKVLLFGEFSDLWGETS